MDKRVRTTSATLRADKRMREIIELISDREPISVCELGIIMGLSSPGIRKYIYRLLESGIVTQHLDAHRQSHITLTAPPTTLARFVKEFDSPEPPDKDVLDITQPTDPACRRHILADDMKVNVKIEAAAPARRDELVAALFGPARSTTTTVLELA